GQQHNSHPLTF
nr:immunoglobulin light chain junction region [Macaca mulatta]